MTQALTILRYLLIALGTWAAGKGWVAPDGVEEAAGIFIALVAAGWGLWQGRPAARVADVAKMPDVEVTTSDPKLAEAARQ